jgi:molybdopterin/thiamine biosynthesis adenylyltransferase
MNLQKVNSLKELRNFGHFYSSSITLIGAGGTGGWFINNLDILKRKSNLFPITTYIFDPDIVEEKNTIRQNFEMDDIGEYKIDAIIKKIPDAKKDSFSFSDERCYSIRKYNSYSGSNIYLYNKKFSLEVVKKFSSDYPHIFITMVDNVDIRLKLNDYLWDNHDSFIHIDVGNNQGNGQIYASFKNGTIQSKRLRDKYPELLNIQNNESTMSCAELSEEVEQILPINYMAGQLTLQYLDYLLETLTFKDQDNLPKYIKRVFNEKIYTEIEFNLIPQINKTDYIKLYMGNRLKNTKIVKFLNQEL